MYEYAVCRSCGDPIHEDDLAGGFIVTEQIHGIVYVYHSGCYYDGETEIPE